MRPTLCYFLLFLTGCSTSHVPLQRMPTPFSENVLVGVNGETWIAIGNDQAGALRGLANKSLLLRGVLDGVFLGEGDLAEHIETGVSYGTLIEGLDEFYEDYRNRPIPIVWGLAVISLELRGQPPGIVEEAKRKYREMTADLIRGQRSWWP